MDRERLLTADHMRQLNQVLAGHLSYAEVPKVHVDRETAEDILAAPSHGSAVGNSATASPLAAAEDEAQTKLASIVQAASLRQTMLRRLVSRL